MTFLITGMTISRRKLLAVTLLFSSSMGWFFVFWYYIDEILRRPVGSFWFDAGTVVFLVSIVISAFMGSIIAGKVSRRKLMFSWLVFGILATIPILFFQANEFIVVYGIIAGLSFGIGFPILPGLLGRFNRA